MAETRFFEAAEPLLARYGYRKTTVKEVCAAAGASKRTFYELFEDKQDLCAKLILNVWNRETDAWEASLAEDGDPEEQLAAAVDFYADVVRRHPVHAILVEDLEIMRTLGSAIEEFRVSRVGGPLEKILRKGIEAGHFRTSDPQLMLWVIFGMLDLFFVLAPRIAAEPGPLENPVLAAEIKEFVLGGVRRRGGIP
jgi:AcrR family transcriptional regulator